MAHAIIRASILGVGNSDLSAGGTLYHGLRYRDETGKPRYLDKVVVPSSVNMLLVEALQTGEPIEMWVSGTPNIRMIYGIKTADDAIYETFEGAALIFGAKAVPLLLVGLICVLGSLLVIGGTLLLDKKVYPEALLPSLAVLAFGIGCLRAAWQTVAGGFALTPRTRDEFYGTA